MMDERVYGTKVNIDNKNVKDFYRDRASKYNPDEPLVSVLFQDLNPQLARERDEFEKQEITPRLGLHAEDSVLDVGCGIGRWADALADQVGTYHGTDLDDGLITIAKNRFASVENVSFQSINAASITQESLAVKPPFSLIIVAGVLQYINDAECSHILQQLGKFCSEGASIYIRSTIALAERLTLSKVWSEELGHQYSSIYRTKEEYVAMIKECLYPLGFSIQCNQPLYPEKLNNRNETQQHIFIMKRVT